MEKRRAIVKLQCSGEEYCTWLITQNLSEREIRLHICIYEQNTNPDTTTLITKLSNAKQTQNESAQEFIIKLMALRPKILFVSNEDRCEYGEGLAQDRFLHGFLHFCLGSETIT